jgi:hypothetical protein
MRNRINQLVTEANQIYKNSNIAMSLRLVHSYLNTDWSENRTEEPLDLMRNNTDPFFVDLNSNRNRYCADLVHLLISQQRDAVGKACKFQLTNIVQLR